MTDEQWVEIEPFITAQIQAREKLARYSLLNVHGDPRKIVETQVVLARLALDEEAAAQAFSAARMRILGI